LKKRIEMRKMATLEEIEELKLASEEARRMYEKAKQAYEDAQQTYSKTKTKEALRMVQGAENALNVIEKVYNKFLDDFIGAMAEFIVEKEKAQARKKG